MTKEEAEQQWLHLVATETKKAGNAIIGTLHAKRLRPDLYRWFTTGKPSKTSKTDSQLQLFKDDEQ